MALSSPSPPSLAALTSELFDSTNVDPNILYLKIHVKQATKTIAFPKKATVAEALQIISEKLKPTEDLGDYGLFIPAWYGGNFAKGWLEEHKTLDSLNLRNYDFVEFRLKVRPIPIKGIDGVISQVSIRDTQTVSQMIPGIVKQLGFDRIPDVSTTATVNRGLNDRLALLDRDVLLLHLPLPREANFLVMKYKPLSEGMTDEDISTACGFYIYLPFYEGVLLKKGEKGLVRGWKRRWFRLVRDGLHYFKSKGDEQPLGTIPVQRVTSVNPSTTAIDGTAQRQLHNCFELETPGRTYYLLAPADEGAEARPWLAVLEEWLEFKRFFGPMQRKTTLAKLVREQSLVRLQQQAAANPAAPRRGTVFAKPRPSDPLPPLSQPHPQLPAAEPAAAAAAADPTPPAAPAPAPTASEQATEPECLTPLREINVVLMDGSIQPLIVDENMEVYDLVYAITEEIGSRNAHQLTLLDHDEYRKVELLDHQLSLKQQNIPSDALFVLKKTGIVDEYIGPEDVYDNHFLYIQLPEIEGFLLVKAVSTNAGDTSPRTHWKKRWVSLRGNKLFIFESPRDAHHITFIPLFMVKAPSSGEHYFKPIPPSPAAPPSFSFSPYGFELPLSQRTMYFIAPSPEERDRWLNLLKTWHRFFRDDGTREESIMFDVLPGETEPELFIKLPAPSDPPSSSPTAPEAASTATAAPSSPSLSRADTESSGGVVMIGRRNTLSTEEGSKLLSRRSLIASPYKHPPSGTT